MRIIIFLLINISFIFAYIGEISALRGKVEIHRDNKILIAKIGFRIEKKDIILTKKNSVVQIIFKDRTIITIGPNSNFSISDYLFDNSKNSKAKFSLFKGIIKVLDGQIGKIAPKKFTVHTRDSIIGIRGTMFVVEIKNDITKVGILEGKVFFKPLKLKKIYYLNRGEYLVYNPKKAKVIIKKGFVEPKIIKITKTKPSKQNIITTTTSNTQAQTSTTTTQESQNISETTTQTLTSINNEENEKKLSTQNEIKINTILQNGFFKVTTKTQNNKVLEINYEIINSNLNILNSQDLNDLINNKYLIEFKGYTFAIINNELSYGMNKFYLDFANQQFSAIYTLKPKNSGSWIFNIYGIINNDGTIENKALVTNDNLQTKNIVTSQYSEVKNIQGEIKGNIYEYKEKIDENDYKKWLMLGGNFNLKGDYNNQEITNNGIFISVEQTAYSNNQITPTFNIVKYKDYQLLGYWAKENKPIETNWFLLDSEASNPTNPTNIQELIDKKANYNYSGDLLTIIDSDHLATGNFHLNIDFGNQKINGLFDIQDNDTLWEFNMNSNLDGNNMTLKETQNSDIKEIDGYINLQILNNNAKNVAGRLWVTGSDSDNNPHTAIGSFIGAKQ